MDGGAVSFTSVSCGLTEVRIHTSRRGNGRINILK